MAQLPLSFLLSFCREIVPGKGEDSYCYSFCDTAGLVAAFDGCGGAGARKHDCYGGHTEAYMASRFCAGVFFDGFRAFFPNQVDPAFYARQVKDQCCRLLKANEPPKDQDGFQIRGSMIRTLPTTAAAGLIQTNPDGSVTLSPLWAGDSRVYILDQEGLHQLTMDDTSVPDPMENLYEDGVLRNIFCSDRDVQLHGHSLRLQLPCMVLAATDGCFGYVSTPMEFEGLLLDTLMGANSVDQWEKNLAAAIGASAGDDHTLVMAGLGYGSFQQLQQAMAPRQQLLHQNYLTRLRQLPPQDRQTRWAMWENYRGQYSKYLKDGHG